MIIKLDITKSIEQNAEIYFEKSKKAKKKIPAVIKVLEENKKKLVLEEKRIAEKNTIKIKRSKEWFEKFRWFNSSDGFLIIGGRDATTNEIVVKKHTENTDLVFHAELPGSPFVIIKNPENKIIPESTINEAAELCASFSKSWNAGRSSAEVYYVHPEQVSKTVQSGFAGLAKGSFMITGKRTYINARINLAICSFEGKIMTGPVSAISKHKPFLEIIQGTKKLSDVGKKIQKIIGGELDEIIRNLPPNCDVKK